MEINDRTFVTIDYTLRLDSGETIDQTTPGNPFGFVFGAGQVIKGLEDGIKGKKAGDSLSLTIEPKDAYGEMRQDLIREIPKANFPEGMELKPGMPFEAQSPHGPVRFTIKEVKDDVVMADFNHPLAGERLHFDIKILEVREPSFAELASLGGACGCDTEPTGGCGTCGGCS